MNKILGNKKLNRVIGILLALGAWTCAYYSGDLFVAFVLGGTYLACLQWLDGKYKEFGSDVEVGSWE